MVHFFRVTKRIENLILETKCHMGKDESFRDYEEKISFHWYSDVFGLLNNVYNPKDNSPGIKNKYPTQNIMKILCILHEDPQTGMPEHYAQESIPKLKKICGWNDSTGSHCFRF